MTIDFSLIQKSIEHSEKQLLKKKYTSTPDLYFLDNFLHHEIIQKINNFVSTNELEWKTVAKQENLNRRQITWIPDTVVEELHIVFENLTNSINDIFQSNYKFNGISIWKDGEFYHIGKHSDNDTIAAALQIYLNSGPKYLNTVFYLDNNIEMSDFKENSGYLMHNINFLKHGLMNKVPKGFTRYSVYSVWSKNDKF